MKNKRLKEKEKKSFSLFFYLLKAKNYRLSIDKSAIILYNIMARAGVLFVFGYGFYKKARPPEKFRHLN